MPIDSLGKLIKQWVPHPEYQRLGRTQTERQTRYRQLVKQNTDKTVVDEIRSCTQKGLALGSERFKDEIEVLGNRRQRLLKRGPKQKCG